MSILQPFFKSTDAVVPLAKTLEACEKSMHSRSNGMMVAHAIVRVLPYAVGDRFHDVTDRRSRSHHSIRLCVMTVRVGSMRHTTRLMIVQYVVHQPTVRIEPFAYAVRYTLLHDS